MKENSLMNKVRVLFSLILFTMLTYPATAQTSSDDVNKLSTIAWSTDGTRIAGVYDDSSIAIWAVENTNDPILTIDADIADDVMWTPDSEYIITQGRHLQNENHLQMSVTKWRATTGELVETLFSFEMDTSLEFNWYGYVIFPAIAIDRTATNIAYSFRSSNTYLSGVPTVLFAGPDSWNNYNYMMQWSPGSTHIAVANGTSDVYNILIFETDSQNPIFVINQSMQYFVTDMVWDSTGKYLATSSITITGGEGWSSIGIYEIEQPTDEIPLYIYSADRWWYEVNPDAASIAWHPIDTILAVATEFAIEFYSPLSDDAIYTIPAASIQDLAWSPDGTQIAGVLLDGTIQIWDYESSPSS